MITYDEIATFTDIDQLLKIKFDIDSRVTRLKNDLIQIKSNAREGVYAEGDDWVSINRSKAHWGRLSQRIQMRIGELRRLKSPGHNNDYYFVNAAKKMLHDEDFQEILAEAMKEKERHETQLTTTKP